MSSKAFGPSKIDKSLSGDLEQPLVADGLTAKTMYPSVPRAVGAASLAVGQLRAHNLDVAHEPVPTDWYHGGVRNIKEGTKRKLLADAVEFIEIDQEAVHLVLADPRWVPNANQSA